jgi:hypothetical protein
MHIWQNRSASCWACHFCVGMLRAISLKSLTLFWRYRKSMFWFSPYHLLLLAYSSYRRRIFRLLDILASLELWIMGYLSIIECFRCVRKEFSCWINTLLPPITIKVRIHVSIDVNVYIYVDIYRFTKGRLTHKPFLSLLCFWLTIGQLLPIEWIARATTQVWSRSMSNCDRTMISSHLMLNIFSIVFR